MKSAHVQGGGAQGGRPGAERPTFSKSSAIVDEYAVAARMGLAATVVATLGVATARRPWLAPARVQPRMSDAALPIVPGWRPVRTAQAFYNFTRPHTLIGSAISIPALHLFAAPAGVPLPWPAVLESITFCMIPSLCINVYIVGLNQVLDIEADRINKPYLPLAKGEFSRSTGIAMSVACLAAGLAIGYLGPARLTSGPLRATLLGSTLLGTAYSLPPVRLKRFPLLASLCITAVRGALVNWGFFTHACEVAYHTVPPYALGKCAMATAFYVLFGVVIALLKDIPDVAGDAAVGTSTFARRFGRAQVFGIATGLLQGAFAVVGAGLAYAGLAGGAVALRRVAAAMLAFSFAWFIRARAAAVAVSVPAEVYAFYMRCWALFYASYAALPMIG